METEINIKEILKDKPNGTKLYADAFGELSLEHIKDNEDDGIKTIYHLMRLSQHDMTIVIKDIIKVRREAVDVILNACDKVEKENNDIIKFLYGGA